MKRFVVAVGVTLGLAACGGSDPQTAYRHSQSVCKQYGEVRKEAFQRIQQAISGYLAGDGTTQGAEDLQKRIDRIIASAPKDVDPAVLQNLNNDSEGAGPAIEQACSKYGVSVAVTE